jgi:hypothetical protein
MRTRRHRLRRTSNQSLLVSRLALKDVLDRDLAQGSLLLSSRDQGPANTGSGR